MPDTLNISRQLRPFSSRHLRSFSAAFCHNSSFNSWIQKKNWHCDLFSPRDEQTGPTTTKMVITTQN